MPVPATKVAGTRVSGLRPGQRQRIARIRRYADLVGDENVMAGSDCGYGTWVGQAAVDPDVVWAKLRALREGADLAST